jgi:Type ISP C-terminal specificity domain/Nucleotidyltransferase domain
VEYSQARVRWALYRPFCRQHLYFDNTLVHRPGKFPYILPLEANENENAIIWLKIGSDWPFFALCSNIIDDQLPQGGSQCFPFYTYAEDGTHRRENITDWALEQFQAHYADASITRRDIFRYIYAVLHHPEYRERYATNLRRELPRIPFAPQFYELAKAGDKLMELHVNYEKQLECRLEQIEKSGEKLNLRVEKRELSGERLGAAPEHWRWRQRFAERIAAAIDPARFGVQAVYLFGSTELGNAGVGSDIDLIVVSGGDARQRSDLRVWLEGWSLCLAEVSFQLYGLPSTGLLDVRFLDPEQAKTEVPSFTAAGSTLQALPLGTSPSYEKLNEDPPS